MANVTNESLNATKEAVENGSEYFMASSLPFTVSPLIDIFIYSLAVSLFITLVNKYMTDQVKIKALRAEMKELQKKMKSIASKDPEEARKLQQQIFQKNMENMKHNMNPKILIITMIPALIVLFHISQGYSQFGEFWDLGFTQFGWLGSYITFSIINSLLLKKLLKVA